MNEKECNCVRCGYCCTEMEIKVLDLIHPWSMSKKGQDFYNAHGLDKILRENGMVKILHRCKHLNGRNECGLEGPFKPAFCTEWVCRRHLRDSQWVKDRLGEIAIEKLERIIQAVEEDGNKFARLSTLLTEYDEDKQALLGGDYARP